MEQKTSSSAADFALFEFNDMPGIVENGIAYQASAQGLLRTTSQAGAAPQTAPEDTENNESSEPNEPSDA